MSTTVNLSPWYQSVDTLLWQVQVPIEHNMDVQYQRRTQSIILRSFPSIAPRIPTGHNFTRD